MPSLHPKIIEEAMRVVGPAVESALHVQDRIFTDDLGDVVISKRAWRVLTPIQACYLKGRLNGGNERYSALSRVMAANTYAAIFQMTLPGSKDSSLGMVIDSSPKDTALEGQHRAIKAIAAIHTHLDDRDKKIIVMVCGECHEPAVAIREVCGRGYKNAVSGRLRKALDALIEAMETARRDPSLVNVERGL